MKIYKLTDESNQSYNNTQWGEGVTHETSGEGDLCGDVFLHAYTHPLLAVLLNPIHENIDNPNLWECEGKVIKDDHGLKVDCKELTTIRQISVPEISTIQKVAFGILCVKERYRDEGWNKWADDWLSGKDRSEESAESAMSALLAAESFMSVESAMRSVALSAMWSAVLPIDLIAIAEKAMGYK